MDFSNQLWGSVTVAVVVLLFWFAFYSAKKEKYLLSISLIFFAGFILRLFTGMDFYLHSWDERYHALAAKNLLQHIFVPTLYEQPIFDYDFKDWGNNHIWVHKPPLTLWLIAASLKIFGIHELAVRIPSILFSSLGIFLTYYIGKYFFKEKTGLLAAFFYAINGFLIELATGHHPTDHPDILFVFFIELGIFFSIYYLQHKSFLVLSLVGIATGCALLTKWLPGLIVIGILFLLLIPNESWKNVMGKCAFVLLITAILVLPWQIYIFSTFPHEAAWESYFNYRHLFEPLDGHDGTMWYHLALMPRLFGELIYIPLIMFLFFSFKKQFSSSIIVLWFWFIVPYLFFSFVATKMPGYVMVSAPAIFIILAWAFWNVQENLKHASYRTIKKIFLVLLVLLPIRYSIERIKPFEQIDRNPVWAQKLRALDSTILQPKAVVFNVDHYIEAMFYSHVTAYPFIPSQEQIKMAKDKGYSVYIFDASSLPSELRNNKNISVIGN